MFNKNFTGSMITAASNVAFCEVDNKLVLMNVDTGYYYGLDEVGKFIWSLLQTPSSFEQIEAAIRDKYEIETAQNSKNLSDLLSNLEHAGLIQTVRTGK